MRLSGIPGLWLYGSRKGIDGMAGIVQQEFYLDPFQEALFKCAEHIRGCGIGKKWQQIIILPVVRKQMVDSLEVSRSAVGVAFSKQVIY